MLLFHGTYENAPFEITNTGLFGGIFAADRGVANSHGENVFQIEIADEKILDNSTLNYHTELEVITSAFETACARYYSNDEEREILWECVIEDHDHASYDISFVSDDFAEASWTCQKLRGRVARAMGYQAVEMNDEHGFTYLVLSGTLSQLED